MSQIISIRKKIERKLVGWMENPSNSFLRGFLYAISLCFQGVIFLRNFFYDVGLRRINKGRIPVICVGNILAGGTGKTPLVKKLVQDLQKDISIAVISKGYRSLGVSQRDVIAPIDKKKREVPPLYCGDEPFLLKKHLPNVEVLMSKDRHLAIKVAKDRGAQIALLDDGFQMRSLAKDLTILVLPARDLFGKGYYLPRGYLRESPKRLKEADFLCLTYDVEPIMPEVLQEKIHHYSKARLIGVKLIPKGVKGSIEMTLEELKGKKVGLFCGIGHPIRYLESVKALGSDVICTLFTADHCLPNEEEFQEFEYRSRQGGAEVLLCTEKDFVKIVNPRYHLLPICYLESDLEVIYGYEYYEELKKEILRLAQIKKEVMDEAMG